MENVNNEEVSTIPDQDLVDLSGYQTKELAEKISAISSVRDALVVLNDFIVTGPTVRGVGVCMLKDPAQPRGEYLGEDQLQEVYEALSEYADGEMVPETVAALLPVQFQAQLKAKDLIGS